MWTARLGHSFDSAGFTNSQPSTWETCALLVRSPQPSQFAIKACWCTVICNVHQLHQLRFWLVAKAEWLGLFTAHATSHQSDIQPALFKSNVCIFQLFEPDCEYLIAALLKSVSNDYCYWWCFIVFVFLESFQSQWCAEGCKSAALCEILQLCQFLSKVKPPWCVTSLAVRPSLEPMLVCQLPIFDALYFKCHLLCLADVPKCHLMHVT